MILFEKSPPAGGPEFFVCRRLDCIRAEAHMGGAYAPYAGTFPMLASRVEYMKLVGYTREQYDARKRRGQLANPYDLPVAEPWSPLQALLNVLQDELNALLGMPLADASRVAYDVKSLLIVGYQPGAAKRWSILVESARAFRSDNRDLQQNLPPYDRMHDVLFDKRDLRFDEMATHVLAGGINGRDAGDFRKWTAVCGTLDEIRNQIIENVGYLHSVALVSLTRAAAKMSERADRHGIDLAEFWAKPVNLQDPGAPRRSKWDGDE